MLCKKENLVVSFDTSFDNSMFVPRSRSSKVNFVRMVNEFKVTIGCPVMKHADNYCDFWNYDGFECK